LGFVHSLASDDFSKHFWKNTDTLLKVFCGTPTVEKKISLQGSNSNTYLIVFFMTARWFIPLICTEITEMLFSNC
jgi:hypothetical protein